MTSDSNPERRDGSPASEGGEVDDRSPVLSDGSRRSSGSPRRQPSPDEDELLENCLERFAPDAPLADPTELRDYLPESSGDSCRFILVELIKLDMAAACESGRMPRIANYVAALPDLLSADDAPLDLVMEEIQLRKEAGDTPHHDEYAQRYPQHKSVLAQLLGAAEATSALQPRSGPPELEIGATIDDFLIIQTLGSGAFAHVYLARQISMQRLVALKVSKGTGGESQALAKFDHPNVVRVFDQRNISDPIVHLLYMQYLPGGTVSDVVKLARGHQLNRRDGNILLDAVDRQLLRAAQVVPERSSVRSWLSKAEWASVVAWTGVQLARALEDAHRHEVLHRDVKPANVMLTAEGIPKLADFNVSFSGAAGRAGASATFGGSIGYMSPEHLRAIMPETDGTSADVREKADFYSLAILLWEMWQGQRPFDCGPKATSWTEAVQGQLAGRGKPLVEPTRGGGGSERVLETTLRFALSEDPDKRPASGAEFVGRLKLALHPEAAGLFNPDENSFRGWLLRRSVWLVAGLVIMLPNIAVGYFNYYYNEGAMAHLNATDAKKEIIAQHLNDLSWYFNPIVFPLGFLIALWRIWPVANAVRAARSEEKITTRDLHATLSLSQHAALIGGGFWIAGGIYYSSLLSYRFEEFQTAEGVHFFISLLICGGIAATYPYFGMALLGSLVYYPRLLRGSMQDADFDQRSDLLIARSESWLLAGAGIPLLGAALLIFQSDDRKYFLLSLVVLTAAGLLASFWAYRYLLRYWNRMAIVLSTRGSSVVPGAQDED